MLKAEGQRRALAGLAQTSGDCVVLFHEKTEVGRWPVDAGFPMLDNRDAGNPGKGELVVTWRATLPASMILNNVATKAQVHDSGGRVVVEGEFAFPFAKVEGKVDLVYVNEHIR